MLWAGKLIGTGEKTEDLGSQPLSTVCREDRTAVSLLTGAHIF